MSEARVNNLSNESNSGGPTISGITTFSGTNFFVPPVGNTAQRPENPEEGSIRFNIDNKHLEYFKGDGVGGWVEVEATSEELNGGYRGVFTGAYNPSKSDTMDYVTISTLGNAIDFGNLSATRGYMNYGNIGSRTRGIWGGGYAAGNKDIIEYITFSILGNTTDFGNLTEARDSPASASNNQIGVFCWGHPATQSNTMDYITIASTGDAVDFGDAIDSRSNATACANTVKGFYWAGNVPGAVGTNIQTVIFSSTGSQVDSGYDNSDHVNNAGSCSNAVRGLLGGGQTIPANVQYNAIEYITMASLGNSVDFGDLTMVWNAPECCSSPTRGLWGGGDSPAHTNTIDYVQIMSLGNAKDFGDLTEERSFGAAASNGHGGL